ncbi:MAG: hypothetical protein ACJLTB_11830 [Algoriphagus aquaeductus]|uniref:hypothetical protein n=1 Tax=Algoriphagus TaxID=246875 RepID=UPI002588EB72|nr:hypothetical protein [Algoriphagus sp.]
MSDTKPNNRIHLILATENMRWFLGIALFFISLGAFPVGPTNPTLPEKDTTTQDFQAETLDVFQFDFSDLIPAEARVRTSSSSSQRLKNDRNFDALDFPGLIFLTCRIAKSYSEIHIDKYLKLLIQHTIQVNAP